MNPKLFKLIPRQPHNGITEVKATIINKFVFVEIPKVLERYKNKRQPKIDVTAVISPKSVDCNAEKLVTSPVIIVIMVLIVDTASENIK